MDLSSPDRLLLTLLVFLFICCVLLSAGRTALTMLNDATVKKMSTSPSRRERFVFTLLEKPVALLDGVRLAQLFCSIAAAISGYWLLYRLIFDRFWLVRLHRNFYFLFDGEPGWLKIAVIFVTLVAILAVVVLLVDVLCVQLPGHIARRYPQPVAMATARFCWVFSVVFTPFVKFNSWLSRLLARLFGVREQEDAKQETEEEIRMLVDVGNEKGEIEQSEKDMINNIFEFDDRYVSEIMTHRTDMIAVSRAATLTEIVSVAIDSGYSRIPVYEDGVDKIIGILYIKDLLCLIGGQEPADFDPCSYMREVLFVPENMSCINLFSLFKQKKLLVAVAVDEYGGTAGLATMEDLLESIVGNIQDEYDDEEEEAFQIAPGCYLFDGTVSIDEVERLMNVTLDAEDESEYDTIGGLLTDALGHIPAPDEHPSVTLGDVCFTVALVEDRRIARVRAERIEPDEEEV